jgi:hypothetical protein
MRNIWCALAFALPAATFAQENCGYAVSLLQSRFEAGEQPPSVVLPPLNTPLTLGVDGLVQGQNVGTDLIQVFGPYTGPVNTGITVNGQAVATTDTRYASSYMRLEPGANTIDIVATTMDGATQTISRSINYVANLASDVELFADGTAGLAPARVNFELRYRIPATQTTLTRVEIDYQGDGTFEFDSTTLPSSISANYDRLGEYLPTIRLSFDDGNGATPLEVRTATTRVMLETLARARQTLCFVYYTMKQRLQPGQSGIVSALNTLTPDLRPEYQQFWTDLGANLGNTANLLGEVVDGRISETMAEYIVAIPDPALPGDFFGFPVVFRRSLDGVWRISEM